MAGSDGEPATPRFSDPRIPPVGTAPNHGCWFTVYTASSRVTCPRWQLSQAHQSVPTPGGHQALFRSWNAGLAAPLPCYLTVSERGGVWQDQWVPWSGAQRAPPLP